MKNYLEPFLKQGKAMLLAYDHGFEHGPRDLIGKSADPEYILDLAARGGYTGIILQKGVAEKYYLPAKYQKQVPLILKINGRTDLNKNLEPYSAVNCSVEWAKKLGAQAVGYTIYLGSEYEARMLEEFGRVQEQAHKFNMAAIAWIYPKDKTITDAVSSEITKYASRLGLELGADMIKIKYAGTEEIMREAVTLAGKTKIVLAGGEQMPENEFLVMVQKAVNAGIIGVAVGRNIWQRKDPLEITRKLKELLFQ